jgi:hypothetical protein
MAIDGTYGFVYSGANGIGIGVFAISDGRIVGSDFVGGRYTGSATEQADGRIAVELTFDVRPGMMLVEGTSPQDVPHSRRITHLFSADFGDGVPEIVNAPPGLLTLMIKCCSDEFAAAAVNGFSLRANEPAAHPTTNRTGG